jgi:copper chaperone CopZ
VHQSPAEAERWGFETPSKYLICCQLYSKHYQIKIKTEWAEKMKIKVESEKIIKAVKKLEGIEIVLENLNDAKEAIQLILTRSGLFEKQNVDKFKDVKVTSFQKYETTAVDYKMIFLLEFIFETDVSLNEKIVIIKELQDFFNKV